MRPAQTRYQAFLDLAVFDRKQLLIYAAIGYATTRWETMEAHLSFMYSIFEGTPLDSQTIQAYGRDAKIFRERMATLGKSAEKYFQKNPDQAQEGRVHDLISEAIRLSIFRHRIAHGIVHGIEHSDKIEFRLVAPSHGLFHLTKKDGTDYSYDVEDIERYANEFASLGALIQKFNHERYAPK